MATIKEHTPAVQWNACSSRTSVRFQIHTHRRHDIFSGTKYPAEQFIGTRHSAFLLLMDQRVDGMIGWGSPIDLVVLETVLAFWLVVVLVVLLKRYRVMAEQQSTLFS